MTCIVGLVDKDNVLIGGDSAGVSELNLILRADEKVFTLCSDDTVWVFGFTTSFRMGQLIRYELQLPSIDDGDRNYLHKFMVKKFIPALRKCLEDGGWLKKEDGREEGGEFLVGVLGKLFLIHDSLQVGESTYPYNAVGCGQSIALGALYASEGHPSPEERILLALKAAQAFSAGVREPFKIVQTKVTAE